MRSPLIPDKQRKLRLKYKATPKCIDRERIQIGIYQCHSTIKCPYQKASSTGNRLCTYYEREK